MYHELHLLQINVIYYVVFFDHLCSIASKVKQYDDGLYWLRPLFNWAKFREEKGQSQVLLKE